MREHKKIDSIRAFLYAIKDENAFWDAEEVLDMARAQSRANETDCSYQRTERGVKMAETRERKREARMLEILGPYLADKPNLRFVVNGDPRGYAFKIEVVDIPAHQAAASYPELRHLEQDWGGYFCFPE